MRNVLKYPGSKWRIAENIVDLIPPHHTYLEPYFGSGAVFFNKSPSDIEMINDLDSNVTNLFQCIQTDPEQLARLVMTTPFSRELYDKQFDKTIKDTALLSAHERATNFLIRCWQGHGYRTNGHKVGWKNDIQGRESMYALWNWYRLPDWIIQVTERLRQVQIENRPALEVIERFNYSNVFMYIDPPYVLSTRKGNQYKYEMTDVDHIELLNTLRSSQAKIMLSGYDSKLYNDLLPDWNKTTMVSHTENGSPRKEYIWFNYEKNNEQLALTF